MLHALYDIAQGVIKGLCVKFDLSVKLLLVPREVHVLVHAIEVNQALLIFNGPNIFQIDEFVDTADNILLGSQPLVFDFLLLLFRKQVLVSKEC